MSVDTGGPAFPIKGPVMTSDVQGMTLRDYFAAKALQRFIGTEKEGGMLYDQVAEVAYLYADAMLKARNA
jgi:hypothetical protein